MQGFLEFFKITGPWAVGLLGFWVVLNVIGEICEKQNKIVPVFMRVISHMKQRKKEKQKQKELLVEVKTLLDDVNKHYSDDNITKRDEWMNDVNNCIDAYHHTAEEVAEMKKSLDSNTDLTNRLYLSSMRNKILDFARIAVDENTPLLHESFNRVFKDYTEYEEFLKEHHMKNGEVEASYKIICEEYEKRLRTHNFVEDHRWKND